MQRAHAPIAEVVKERERMNAFIRHADATRRWRHIVHIGIGGSDWGVRLTVNAFGYTKLWRNVRFVANIDGHAIASGTDRKSTRLNSSHVAISYAVFCLKKKNNNNTKRRRTKHKQT